MTGTINKVTTTWSDHAIEIVRRLYWRAVWLVGAHSLSVWLLATPRKGHRSCDKWLDRFDR